jgi:hypothetical protein
MQLPAALPLFDVSIFGPTLLLLLAWIGRGRTAWTHRNALLRHDAYKSAHTRNHVRKCEH